MGFDGKRESSLYQGFHYDKKVEEHCPKTTHLLTFHLFCSNISISLSAFELWDKEFETRTLNVTKKTRAF